MNLYRKLKRIFVIASASVALTACSGDFNEKGPNKEYVDLENYFEIVDIDGNEGVAIIIDGLNVGKGFIKEGNCYVPYECVREYIDDHYYWDNTEKILSYASSKRIYDVVQGVAEYKVNGAVNTYD